MHAEIVREKDGTMRVVRTLEGLAVVEIELRDINSIVPHKAHTEDAAYDLYANFHGGQPFVSIEPFERIIVPVGFKMKLQKGFKANILPRSGLAIKKGLTVVNSPGTIDAGFRDEIGVIIINLSNDIQIIEKGERIAQMDFQEVIPSFLKEVNKLSPDDYDRKGGFGSTGEK